MFDDKCEEHDDDIHKIRIDVTEIRAMLESGKYPTQKELYSEVEKLHGRINKTILGLSFIVVLLGGAISYFIKNGI